MSDTIETLATDVKYIREGFEDLKTLMTVEFTGMKERQDKTNGRVTAQERKWIVFETEEATRKKMTKDLKDFVWKIAASVTTAVILSLLGVAWIVLKSFS